MILNYFLPKKSEATEREINLLYIDGSKKGDFRFYLDNVTTIKEIGLIEKLDQVGFRDTYCDQPFRYQTKLLKLLLETSMI